MEAKKFCPSCGHEVSNSDKFCQNCGAKLDAKPQPPIEESGYSRQKQVPKKINKKVAIIIGIVVLLLGGYIAGRSYYSPAKQLDRFITALTSDGDISSYLVSSNAKVKVTKEEATAFKRGLEHEQIATMHNYLLQGRSYDDYMWVKSGSHFLIFPAYKLQVNPAYVTLNTNQAKVKFYQDGKLLKKKISKISDGYRLTLGYMLPGKYTFSVKGTASGKPVEVKKQSNVTAGEDNNIDLRLETISLKVEGEAGQTVYIDKQKVGTLNHDGELIIKNYPITQNSELYLQAKVGDKELKSQTVSLSRYTSNYGYDDDDYPEVEPKFTGLLDDDEAEDVLESAFNEGKTELSANYFVGEENNDSYNELVAFFKSLNNFRSFEINKINKIEMIDTNKFRVSYSVKYVFYNYSSGQKKIQQFTYNGAELVYDEKDDSYKVQSIGKTSTQADWERNYSDDEDDD